MHHRVHEWACVRDTCPKRFHPTFEELIDPELLIVMGRPDCYRCHQRRDMTRVGNVVRFECSNPNCNELWRLISAKNKRARAIVSQAAAATILPTDPGAAGRIRSTTGAPRSAVASARRPAAR
ncbi:hypothetical protein E3O11_12895 [Cryobacterium levicorallinum]|nr:hypothetical protein [Cryobacterium levicorallinum]TFB82760.1 hypothetical protein E3O11_12895 [Cryobacterium levicorallinum]GEP26462.1 hypothetical protein CLE01_10600 [Cryobacterium levicorallinum]